MSPPNPRSRKGKGGRFEPSVGESLASLPAFLPMERSGHLAL